MPVEEMLLMPLTLKMVASEVLMCGLKQIPVVGTAFEVVDALRASHAHSVVGDRLADIEAQLTRWEKRQRDLVAEEIQTILGNLARPGMDGASLTEEIRNLRQIQEQGWNPSLFEGLMLNSTHLTELKRNPHHYGRILDDRDPVDPTRGIIMHERRSVRLDQGEAPGPPYRSGRRSRKGFGLGVDLNFVIITMISETITRTRWARDTPDR
jgi:CheY-like chemotaxis protein